jgi:ATP-dependent protease ClpP protease subunit
MSDKENFTKILSLQLIGDIDSDKAGNIIGVIDGNKEQGLKRIELLLSSAGGYIYPTFMLFDYFKSLKIPIHITATGRCQSCALALLQAGAKRISRKHTLFGVHPNAFTISEPKNISDIHAEIKSFELQNEFFLEMLVHHNRTNQEVIKKLCEKEFIP